MADENKDEDHVVRNGGPQRGRHAAPVDGVIIVGPDESLMLTRDDFRTADGRLVVHGEEGSRAVVQEGAARPGDMLIAAGALRLECDDPRLGLAVVDKVRAVVKRASSVLALGHSEADVDYALSRRAFPVTADDYSLCTVRGDGRLNSVRVTGTGHATVVAKDVPDLRLDGKANGAVFGDTKALMSGASQADLYDRSSAVLHHEALANVMDDARAEAYDDAIVTPGQDPAVQEPMAGYGNVPEEILRHGAHHAPDPANVRLMGDADDPTGTFGAAGEIAAQRRTAEAREVHKASTAARVLSEAPAGADGPQDEPAR